MKHVGYNMIYVSSSLHLHLGEENSCEKLLGRVASAGFSGQESFTCLCELVKKQRRMSGKETWIYRSLESSSDFKKENQHHRFSSPQMVFVINIFY